MATFVLVPGAGGVAWYWHRVVPLLQGAGHDVVAVDLPGDDERAGLAAYADRVVDAMGARRDVAHERLNATVDVLAGGHLMALSNPRGLVERLLAYLAPR